MTTIHHAHQRTSPPRVRKAPVRAQRPAQLSRALSSQKLLKPLKSTHATEEKDEDSVAVDEDDDMATSFLQFCAMCEKQIIVPNNSILYCSENCRRKDATKSLSSNPYLSLVNSAFPSTSSQDLDDPFGVKFRDIIPRCQPTARPLNSARIPPIAHEGNSDLDPTEWKPNLEHRPNSQAFQYLSQFHRSTSTLASSRRPALQSRSTTSMLAATIYATPSLSYTPTTSTSSEESLAGTPYEFVTRPMPPRHDATYSASATVKSVDLVIPQVATAFSVPGNDSIEPTMPPTKKNSSGSPILGDISYEKKWVLGSKSPATGSLKKLLGLGPKEAV